MRCLDRILESGQFPNVARCARGSGGDQHAQSFRIENLLIAGAGRGTHAPTTSLPSLTHLEQVLAASGLEPIDGDLCNSTYKRLTLLTTGGRAADSTSSHSGDGAVATAAATRAAAQYGHVLDAASSTKFMAEQLLKESGVLPEVAANFSRLIDQPLALRWLTSKPPTAPETTLREFVAEGQASPKRSNSNSN